MALALVATATLGLAACGDDEPEEATVAPDAAAGAPTTTATVPAPAGNDDEARAGAVVAQYIAAFSVGDGGTVCKLFTTTQRKRVADAYGGTCAAGIRGAFAQGGGDEGFKRSLGGLRVGKATVTGRKAVVELVALQGGGTQAPLDVELERSGKTWRISRPSGAG